MEQNIRRMALYAGYFISGAAIGAALGVFLAPKSGRATREELSQWLKRKREKGRVEYQAMREALDKGRKTFREKEKELTVA